MLENCREEFLHPDSEFSPMPFWFWNDTLSREEISSQIMEFKQKGVDGFVIHPRIGLPLEMKYLSDEFMEYVRFAVECAARQQMKVVLYDEAMYPSGSAHGEVVRHNPEFASKGLRMSDESKLEPGEQLIAAVDIHLETGERIEAEGEVPQECKRFYFIMTNSGGTIRGIHFGEDDGEPNAPKSADLLNPQAVKCFIHLTHDRYYECLSEHFGDTVIAMFTDEPMILGRCVKDNLIEWTGNFLEYYIEQGGKIIDLPLLFETDTKESEERKRYQKAVKHLLAESFYKQIADWCHAHRIMLTGHPESSQDIGLLKYFDIPCQDIVWRYVEPGSDKGLVGEHSTMAKCSSDSARHHYKLRNGNECFGCCGAVDNPFLFTKDDMKWYLDWLFVRGVNMIYPHAFFYSLREGRKDERPPDVGRHSNFWQDYHQSSDYIKRMSQLLTGSINQTDIAVLCTEDKLPWKCVKELFENQIEFNYVEEELLYGAVIEEGEIHIAEQSYRVIITEGELDLKMQHHLGKLQQSGIIVLDGNEEGILRKIKECCGQDISINPENKDLRKTHIRKGNADFILLTNEGEKAISTQLCLNCGQITELWDAQLGITHKLLSGTKTIKLELERRKSIIIVVQS